MIKVLLHRVAIKQFDFNEWDEDRKKAKELGFVLPETEKGIRAQASVDIGTVEQIGPTAFKDFGGGEPIKVGDVVGFVKNSGKLVKNPLKEDESLLVINDEDVTCIFSKES